MKKRQNRILAPASCAALLLVPAFVQADDLEEKLSGLTLPPGFEISVYAEVENARQMAMGDGVLYVGSRRAGKLHAIVDTDGDMVADEVTLIADDLNLPSGIAWRDGDLYVGAVNQILRYADLDNRLDNPPEAEVIKDDLPSDRHHGWKYLAFGPDGMLYIPVGAPCNICLSENPVYAAISRMDVTKPDELEIIANGVRNTVGFDFHPETGNLWFTDNGRDWLGDEIPPCELNELTEDGQHFGYPYLHGDDVIDPEFGDKKPDGLVLVNPQLNLGPHTAPLGMKFYRGDQFPTEFRHRALIAEHGSWNRTEEAGPIGYRITMATERNGKFQYETFIDGWLDGDKAWGRPVDLLELADGSMLLSDDLAGVVYRISYSGD